MSEKQARLPLDRFDPFRDELDALIEQWAGDAKMDLAVAFHRARRKIGCSAGQKARRIKERMAK